MKKTLVFLFSLLISLSLFASSTDVETGHSYLNEFFNSYDESLKSLDSFDSAERSLSFDLSQNKDIDFDYQGVNFAFSDTKADFVFEEAKGSKYTFDMTLKSTMGFSPSDAKPVKGVEVAYLGHMPMMDPHSPVGPAIIRHSRPTRTIVIIERDFFEPSEVEAAIEPVAEPVKVEETPEAAAQEEFDFSSLSGPLFPIDTNFDPISGSGEVSVKFSQDPNGYSASFELDVAPSFTTAISVSNNNGLSDDTLVGDDGVFGSEVSSLLLFAREYKEYVDYTEKLSVSLSKGEYSAIADVALSSGVKGDDLLSVDLLLKDGESTLLDLEASTNDESILKSVNLIDVPTAAFFDGDTVKKFSIEKLVVDGKSIPLDEAVKEIDALLK